MRVALVGPYPLDVNRITGGPQAVFAYLLEGFRQFKELDLHVVSAHKQVAQITEFRRDEVMFHFLPHPSLPFELAFPLLRRRIRQALKRIKPDLVHAQSAHLYGAVCMGLDNPTAVTVHSLPGAVPRFGPNWIARRRLTLHEAWTSRTFFTNARHVVSISEYIHQRLAPRMHATFYPIDNPVADAFFELPSDQTVPGQVLFVGMLRRIKRPDLALEALALARQEIPGLHLRFAGAAMDRTLQVRMRDLIAQNELEKNVNFLGHLPETQLLEAYRRASILLLTSELETSPMAIEQAMAAGKAVVATKVGGVPFLVDDGRTGLLVVSNDPGQIAQALVKLSRDHELRCMMGEGARQEALTRFKPEVVAAKTCVAYQKILADGRIEELS